MTLVQLLKKLPVGINGHVYIKTHIIKIKNLSVINPFFLAENFDINCLVRKYEDNKKGINKESIKYFLSEVKAYIPK